MSLFDDVQLSHSYFTPDGPCIETAINKDSVPMLEECIQRGMIDKTSRAIDCKSILVYARYRNAEKCAAHLAKLGYPEELPYRGAGA